MPVDDWFCPKLKQMNLHLFQGHVSMAGDRNWLQTDQFLKPPKSQVSGTSCILVWTHQLLDQGSQSTNGPAMPPHLTVPLPGSLSL